MRILHTSDWHMGDTLGRIDRSADIVQALEQIANYLEEHNVDVMLATGDLFSDRLSPEKLRTAIAEIRRIFLPFLARGGTLLAISGNHDNETFFETLRYAMDMGASIKKTGDGTHLSGRLYLAANPRLIRLTDKHNQTVQFILMPYPTARGYLRGEKTHYNTIEEKHCAIQQRFVATLNELKSRLNHHQPSVLLSHINVRGTEIHNSRGHQPFRMSEVEDVIFEPDDVPSEFAYVAYGHIHKAQEAVRGAAHIRYAGSIERMDIAESSDQKSVVLLELGKGGLLNQPTLLNLKPTPMLRFEIANPNTEIPQLAARFKDSEPQRALVQYTLRWQPDKHNLDEISKAIEAVFPRWYHRDLIDASADNAQKNSFTPQRVQDVVNTVRQYLSIQVEGHSQRDELLALAEAMLAEEVWK